MDSKTIMVIAGSKWQIPIIKKIKSLGFKTLVVNLYEDSPAFEFSDYSEVCDILDKEKCLEIANKYNIAAVLSEECDIAMPTVAFIAEALDLPSLGSTNAALYTNKYLMREFCFKHNIPSPAFKKCFNKEDGIEFLRKINKKCILKPLDANSSRGVYTINNLEDFLTHYQESLTFSKTEKAVLLEEYVDGPEFTVDGIMTPQGHKSLAISIKKHYPHNKNIASELFFNNHNSIYDYNELRLQNDKFVNTSNLRWGTLTHAEYKYSNGKFYLIEIAARGGGNLISSHIVPLISGVDNYAYYINSLFTNTPRELDMTNRKISDSVVLKFFDINKAGTIKDIIGLDLISNNPNIIYHQFNFKTGDWLQKAEDDSKRIGFYIAQGDSEKDLRELINRIDNNVKFDIQ